MNHKNNKQYIKTETVIHEALLEILNEQKTPSISEICRRSNINRTTFYLHYTDILDLLEAQQNQMNQKFMNDCKNSNTELSLMSYTSYVLFANHVKENKDFYRYFFRVNTNFPLKVEYDAFWFSVAVPYYHSIGLYDENIMKLRFVCFQAGFTLTLGKWVENNCDLTCEEIASILTECITL